MAERQSMETIGPNIFHHKIPVVTQNLTVAKLAILTKKYLHLLKIRLCNSFNPLLTWVMIDTSVSTQTASQLAALEPCIKQCDSIRYNFLVTDYQYSTAISHFVKCTLSYWPAALQHIIPVHPQHFWWLWRVLTTPTNISQKFHSLYMQWLCLLDCVPSSDSLFTVPILPYSSYTVRT